MGRPPKYSSDQILDTAQLLLAADGIAGLSVTRVADRLGAPSGSIYHRFGSRDLLVASLWLRAVSDFQNALGPALGEPDAVEAARAMAQQIISWARTNPLSAQVLMLHRSTDLLDGEWPVELVERSRTQRSRVEQMIGDLCNRLGAVTTAERRRVVFAVIDIPYGAVRSSLSTGDVPPPEIDAIVDDAVTAVLDPLDPHDSTKDSP